MSRRIPVKSFLTGWDGDLSMVELESTSPSKLVIITGTVRCYYPDKFGSVKEEEKFVSICTLPNVDPNATAVSLCPSFNLVRVAGSELQVKVFKGSRLPKSITIPCLVVSCHVRPNRRLGGLSYIKLGNVVALSGSVKVDGGIGDKPATREVGSLPAEGRPQTDLEFLLPLGYKGDVVKAVVYANGRVVIDSCRPLPMMCAPDVFLNSIIFNTSSHSDYCVGGLKIFHLDDNLVMAQGKIDLSPSSPSPLGVLIGQIPNTEDRMFLIPNKMASSKLDERTTYLQTTSEGEIRLLLSETTETRVLAVAGLCWSPAVKPVVAVPRWLRGSVDAITDGVGDYMIRNRNGKFRPEKFKETLASRSKTAAMTEGESSAWARRLLFRYPSARNGWREESAEHESLSIASEIFASYRSILSRLKLVTLKTLEPTQLETAAKPSPVVFRMFAGGRDGADIMQWLRVTGGRKCKHQMDIAKRAEKEGRVSDLEKLQEIVNWWNSWNTNEKSISHSSLMGNQDIFTNTGKWRIPDDEETQSRLFKYMAWIFKQGYDTFISEIQTPLFPLIEDLDMESDMTMDNTENIDRIFLDEALCFIKERARALQVLYPTRTDFTVHIYSSSGYNKSKKRWKSSFHLVWPDLIVNGDLAPVVRQTTVEYFVYKSDTTVYFKEMQRRLVNNYEANIWENVFDQTTSNANNGLRMPYCNKATWSKNEFGGKTPSVENRHCYPKGSVHIRFSPTEFESPELEAAARTRAMKQMDQAEARDRERELIDQNKLVGDRTKVKQADKNTTQRTSAFIAGMKGMGGDMREFWKVDAKWVERVDDAKSLSEDEIAKWIRRGSCRRANAQLTEYNKAFVETYFQADLKFFEGYTLEMLRESDRYQQLTPAGQQGLKNRLKKYLQQTRDGVLSLPASTVAERMHDLAQRQRQLQTFERQWSAAPTGLEALEEEGDEEEDPPSDNDFDMLPEPLRNVFSFHGSMAMWRDVFGCALRDIGAVGYWIKAARAVIWISPKIEERRDMFDSCLRPPVYSGRRADSRGGPQQVTVSLYHHCGKVVVCGDKKSAQFATIVETVRTITKPDDRLFHRLPDTSDLDHLDMMASFPLLDAPKADEQRKKFEQRWLIMSSDSTAESETTS